MRARLLRLLRLLLLGACGGACNGEEARSWEGAYLGQLSRSARFTVDGQPQIEGGGADNAELRIAQVRPGRYRLEMPGCAAEADVSGERLHVDPRTHCVCVAGEARAEATVAGEASREDGQLRVRLDGTTADGTCEWRFSARP